MQDLSSKVIVGGVNLLETAEQQEKLLEVSAKELAKRKKKEAKLTQQLRRYIHVYTCICSACDYPMSYRGYAIDVTIEIRPVTQPS